jgi:hypothetical protein
MLSIFIPSSIVNAPAEGALPIEIQLKAAIISLELK